MTTTGFIQAEACNARKEAIDTFASKVATQLGYSAGAPLQPIVERLGGHIIYETLEALGSASILVRRQGDFEIFLPHDTSAERDRFSIAHELGHYMLHFPMKGQQPMVAQRFGSTRVEWEANWFAAGFLMPATEFNSLFVDRSSLSAVARHFGVSMAAAEARAKALGRL